MPTNLSLKASQNWPLSILKRIRLTVLLLVSPLFFFGQTLTGLWTGALSNDSSTVRKDQSFEIVLTEYRGKVTGYSRSEFIVDDTLYYVMKKVKGTIADDICEVVDEEIISYNFRGKLDKGVKVTSIFRKNKNDSTWYLDGTWKTNATKKYYAVTGKVNLEEEKDLLASKIFPHLEELNLANNIAFYKDRKETEAIVRVAKPEKIKTEYSTKEQPQLYNQEVVVAAAKPELQRAYARPVPAVSEASTAPTVATNKPESKPAVAETTIAEQKEEIVAVKKPVAELPKTDTRTITAATISNKPASTLVASEKTADLKIAEAKDEIASLEKPVTNLPKTGTKAITTASVNNMPANSLVASDKTADLKIAEAKEEIASLEKPVTNLPKTGTKAITTASVNNMPANSLVASDKTADLKIAEAKEEITSLEKPVTDLPKTGTKAITTASVNNLPANSLVASEKTADLKIAEAKDEIASPEKPLTNLPKTGTKKIDKTTVLINATASTKTKAENKIPVNTVPERTVPVTKTIAKQETPVKTINPPVTKPQTGSTTVAKTTNPATTNNTVKTNTTVNKQENNSTATTKTEPVIANKPVPETKATRSETVTTASVIPQEKKPAVDIMAKAALISGRKTAFSQIVSFTSDSLVLSLYDNGEIDGDIVSIYLNGDVVMSKQELKASAIKKTIYITQGNEDFSLVLFAENLGKYPPNTGLLVVHDGEDVYNLRFSSDFEKNAGIIFRRKK
jgi:protein tyrosine phosphatase (PTP) superfamily phosphohydrolase (DUF442 family)